MIEHGAATRPRPGSGRAVDLLLLPERGVYGLAVGLGTTGGWAARKALDALRERSEHLAELAITPDGGPEVLACLQDAFDHAAFLLHQQSLELGVPTQAELVAAVCADDRLWLGAAGGISLLQGDRSQTLASPPVGVMVRSQPELLVQELSGRNTLVLSSAPLEGPLSDRDPNALARTLAEGLDGEQGVLVFRATAGGALDGLAELRATRLFEELDALTLQRLQPYLLERRVSAGQEVFAEGDPGDRLYVVLEGRLRVSRRGVNLTSVGPGQHFGELAVHLAGQRTATVTAETEARLVSLHRRHLRELSERQPRAASVLLQVLLQDVAVRLRDLTDSVTE